jgi:hypothetical protein
MSLIIGFTGKPRAGKDTAASRLVEYHGFTRIAFADPIREAMMQLDPYVQGCTRLSYVVNKFGWEYAKDNWTEVRRLLQVFGTEVGRDLFGQDVWVERLMAYIDSQPSGHRIAITDVRFEDEAKALRDRGAFIVCINRTSEHSNDVVLSHRSETESAGILPNYVVPNQKGLEELYFRLDRLVPRLAKQRRNL